MTDKEYICKNCNREITTANYPQHGDWICWGSRNDRINYENDPEVEIILASEFIEKFIH